MAEAQPALIPATKSAKHRDAAANDDAFSTSNNNAPHLANINHIEHELARAEKILAHLAATYPDDPDIAHALGDVRSDISSKNFTSSAVQKASKLVIGRDKDVREHHAAEMEESREYTEEHSKHHKKGILTSVSQFFQGTPPTAPHETPAHQESASTTEQPAKPKKHDRVIVGELEVEPQTNDAHPPHAQTPHSTHNGHDAAPQGKPRHPNPQNHSDDHHAHPHTQKPTSKGHSTSGSHHEKPHGKDAHRANSGTARHTSPDSPHHSTTSEPHKVHTKLGKIDGKAGKAITRASLGVNAAAAVNAAMNGDSAAAIEYSQTVAIDAAMEAATHKTARDAAEKTATKLGIAGFKAVSAKVPVWGGVVAGVFAVYDIGNEAVGVATGKSNWKKLASTTASSVVQVAGGVVGFGAGEVGQEIVHAGTKKMFGEKDAAGHSATVEVAILASELTKQRPKVHENFQNKHRDNVGDRNFDKALQGVVQEMNSAGIGRKIGNKDGILTVDEIKATLKKHHISIADIDKPVKDGVGDGKITAVEVIAAMQLRGAFATASASPPSAAHITPAVQSPPPPQRGGIMQRHAPTH